MMLLLPFSIIAQPDWDWNMPFHIFGLHFMFRMNTDSLSTFGKIEVTGDNGITWINMMEEDTIYDFGWWYGKPTTTIFPNPATDKISIITSRKLQGEKLITIFSLNGEKIFQDHSWNQQQFEMNVSSLTSGIYFLTLVSEDEVETIKLVIQ